MSPQNALVQTSISSVDGYRRDLWNETGGNSDKCTLQNG